MKNECVFKRGKCSTHNLKGIKNVISTKKWMKKKFGFGWVTSKRTEYTCPGGDSLPEQPKTDPTDVVLSKSPVQGVQGGSDIFHFNLLGSEDDQIREVATE